MNRILVILLVFCCFAVYPQSYRSIPNKAFVRGEMLTFRVAFNSALTGSITGGKATLEIMDDVKLIENRNTYHVVGIGKTTGLIEMIYKVNDRFESYFDQDALIARQFIRRTRENNYKKDDLVIFRQRDKLAVSLSKIVKVPANVQDVISAFYYARTLDISDLKPGETFEIPFFLDDSVYHSRVIYKGRETVKTKLGKFRCVAFQPMVATGYAFDDPYPITIWITDDANRLPVLIDSEQSVGRARVELISYSGLANPITAKIPD
ncbi:MAG TPA: DUF3108 domain-containing protein [Bacteroidales bacterium]|nr:DUF3108 domain-containing protein [Bacteroidales bacterium]